MAGSDKRTILQQNKSFTVQAHALLSIGSLTKKKKFYNFVASNGLEETLTLRCTRA
jgi:hypothetical protein